MIQKIEGCSIVKTNSISLDDTISPSLNVRGFSLNLTLSYIKPKKNKLQFLEDLDNLRERFSLESIPHILYQDFNIDASKKTA